MPNDPPLALITGASSGIGLKLASRLAKDRFRLWVTARQSDHFSAAVEQLRSIASAEVNVHHDSLADPASVDRLFAELNGQTPDVLVNNAGFGTHGSFADSDMQNELDLIHVNVLSLIHLTRLILPGMRQRGRGRILNVSSTASFQPGPYMATYYASKAFVTSFSLALHEELRGSGVTATALCPGPTATNFQTRARVADTPLFRNNTMSAQAVADIGYAAMNAGKPLAICGTKNKLLSLAVKFAPVALATRVAGRLNAGR